MNTHTIKALQQIAKDRGLRGYSRLRKADLIAAIKAQENFPVKFRTLKQLRQKAKKRGLKLYSKLQKTDLIAELNAHI